jgi:hypothetical protein
MRMPVPGSIDPTAIKDVSITTAAGSHRLHVEPRAWRLEAQAGPRELSGTSIDE